MGYFGKDVSARYSKLVRSKTKGEMGKNASEIKLSKM